MEPTRQTLIYLCCCHVPHANRRGAEALRKALSAAGVGDGVILLEEGCSAEGLAELSRLVRQEEPAVAVVATCSPALWRPVFAGALDPVPGLHWTAVNPYHRSGTPIPAEEGVAVVRAALRPGKGRDEGGDETAPVSRALVVGGGVAGIQASLDIANAGYDVVLVEQNSSIGGHMLQLSEVFPTLDCPQCIMTPKMVEVAQHDKVDLRACSEVEAVEGEAGRYRVRIRRKSTYIQWDKCTGCGECAAVCPVEVFSDWERGIAPAKATSRPFAQAVPNKFRIEKRGLSPCRAACPAECNAHGYVALASAGKWPEAYRLITERIPFPGIVGRVCPHPCERACHRGGRDEPVSICALKRFIADRVRGEEPRPEPGEDRGKSVAVVGAGPAGLTAAIRLRTAGYGVTVYEATDRAGGMVTWGIPAFRLPRDVADFELGLAERLGATLKYHTRLGKDVTLDDLRREHDGVILALGAAKSWPLAVPGDDAQGVESALDFLARVNGGKLASLSGPVVVVGGGSAALDAARTAVRLGASPVTLTYSRSETEVPVVPEELAAARAEGVDVACLVSPVEVLAPEGRVTGLRCTRNEFGAKDEAGRRPARPVPGSTFEIEAGLVIAALGQSPDVPFLEADPRVRFLASGAPSVDPVTLETGLAGVFAAGDLVTGPDTVVGAIAGGLRAADSAVRLLEGRDPAEDRDPPPRPVAEPPDRPIVRGTRRAVPAARKPEDPLGFEEAHPGLTEEQALAEARRCLNCAACCECLTCVDACEPKAIDHVMEDRFEEEEFGAIVVATGYELYPVQELDEYDSDPDVIDALQFERFLCPSGPTDGMIYRPSDGQVPRDVVIVACAGSRDPEKHMPYCSRVCCLYSTKLAMLYKHAFHEGNVHYFYIDVRTDGKMYEEFYHRAQHEEGVHYIKGRVSRVYREGDRLVVLGADMLSGRAVRVETDLVVLAMAMVPNPAGRKLAETLGLASDAHGFLTEEHGLMMPLESSRAGVFFAGTCQGPKDIPECVAHASGTAGRVLSLFGSWRNRPAPAAEEVPAAVMETV